MKRIVKMMALVAVAAGLAFASCQKEDSNSTAANNGGSAGTEQPVPNPNPQPIEEWVDLGLPSGLLWATCNLGATTPEGYGDYYAWGETATKEAYNWSTYRFCNGNFDKLTKYCNASNYGHNGFTDNRITLEAVDDVATQMLGDGARMPTAAEWRELLSNTTSVWATRNGIKGCKLTSKTNGKILFMPAAGYRWSSELYNSCSDGYYWSSSLYAGSTNNAWAFEFDRDLRCMDESRRSDGLSVRPVRSAR